jgi:hypothetical protein
MNTIMNTETPTTTLRPLRGYLARVTRETLATLQSEYPDSGYLNVDCTDMIVDLAHVDDQRDEFATHLGVSVDDLPDDGVILIHI